jgi:hypothetical protein
VGWRGALLVRERYVMPQCMGRALSFDSILVHLVLKYYKSIDADSEPSKGRCMYLTSSIRYIIIFCFAGNKYIIDKCALWSLEPLLVTHVVIWESLAIPGQRSSQNGLEKTANSKQTSHSERWIPNSYWQVACSHPVDLSDIVKRSGSHWCTPHWGQHGARLFDLAWHGLP